MDDFDRGGAVDAWERVVGSANLIRAGRELEDVSTATFATAQQVLCVVRPADRAEVEECVRVANQFRTPIYPVSRGRNWGLGSRVPVQSGNAVLDLSRLDRIVDFDEKLAYITVEPGTTFQQVHEFLRDQDSSLIATVTGGPPDGSLIGNAVDRGEGPGPHGDRAAHVCGFEVVLPTGETIRTGFGRFVGARTSAATHWGVGPALDGLFLQSNLGIVIRMTFWLHPRPRCFQTFNCVVPDTTALPALIDAIQPLVLRGTLASHSFGLWNVYKMLAERGRFPWSARGSATPLSIRTWKGKEPWFAGGALYSDTPDQQAADRQKVLDALGERHRPPEFSSPDSHAQNPYLGVPTTRNLGSMYWRKKHGPQSPDGVADPDRDRCGVLWVCPALPFDGQEVMRAMQIVESTVTAHGLEPNVGMTAASGRVLNAFVALMFDRDVTGEDERAAACHDQLLEQLLANGYPPYRLGVQSILSLPPSGTPYEALVKTLKRALDPNDILAPGRYDFRRTWRDTEREGRTLAEPVGEDRPR